MAKTKGTHPYSSSPGEPRCSGRNQRSADKTGGARKSPEEGSTKGAAQGPSGITRMPERSGWCPCKDQESLDRDSAAALEYRQPTVGNPPTHLNAQAQLHRKDQESLS